MNGSFLILRIRCIAAYYQETLKWSNGRMLSDIVVIVHQHASTSYSPIYYYKLDV